MQGIYSGVESNNYFHDGNTEIKIDDSNFILPFSTYVRHIRIWKGGKSFGNWRRRRGILLLAHYSFES